MSKIRALSDQLINQIAAGEVVERPASVAKELVENSIDAGARRIHVEVEGGGRRLLRVADDGEGMSRDDALLAFERHATSKIASAEDLFAIATLGFRGEALASIASVARVEMLTKTEEAQAATRVMVEGGRIRDVKDAAHTRGTTFTVRDLFFNVPARRKFLRSEATESFHLTNLVTHYALAHPEIAFTLTNNGRETLRCAPARNLRERAFQLFGEKFIENLLEVSGRLEGVASISGFISSPRERRTSRDAQYLFINGRYVRDQLIARSLGEGYRTVLPQGVYPAALLFLEVPLAEVDVNVHPAKTEVRFRRAAAVADSVREAVRRTLAATGYLRASEEKEERREDTTDAFRATEAFEATPPDDASARPLKLVPPPVQSRIEFALKHDDEASARLHESHAQQTEEANSETPAALFEEKSPPHQRPIQVGDAASLQTEQSAPVSNRMERAQGFASSSAAQSNQATAASKAQADLPPVASLAGVAREVPLEALSTNIRPLGQLESSYIIATDDEGLLLIDQHIAHERILFDRYCVREEGRAMESQNLLMPETFDLTPAQAAVFDEVVEELETFGFGLMRLSGRTVAIKAVPADLPAGEARSLLAELLDSIEASERPRARVSLHERIAQVLACHAAIKSNTVLAPEKMRWLIDNLLVSASPTTGPHGRPVALRLATRDIEKSFRRT